jgi:hypothetical protein
MATDRQIAANRANSKKSTGPHTQAGRARSSSNSRSHGLSSKSCEQKIISDHQPMIDALAGAGASSDRLDAARHFLCAKVKLMRVAEQRHEMFADFESSTVPLSRVQVRRYAALDRYERYAYTQLYRAIKGLDDRAQFVNVAITNPISL